MVKQAPYSYIADYYDSVQKKNAAFPEIAAFWLDGFRHVQGDNVLNLGCGPTFYDNLMHFGAVPKRYVGLDLNENSFTFIKNGTHPALIEARNYAKQQSVETTFIAGNVFDHVDELENTFDCILGIGFFATFEGETFEKLLAATRKMLKPNGHLLKMTWHGSQRNQEETEAKLKYRYDNEKEPSADELVSKFLAHGFRLVENDLLNCPPDTVGWQQIQVALFQKTS